MKLLKVLSKASKVVGITPGPHRKKRLFVAVGGLLLVILVKFGVPLEIAEAMIEVFQAAAG
jgi:hypothetical protein